MDEGEKEFLRDQYVKIMAEYGPEAVTGAGCRSRLTAVREAVADWVRRVV